jgi:hypothetical protein
MKKIILCAIISVSIIFPFFSCPVSAVDDRSSDLASGTAVVSAFLRDSDGPVDYRLVSRAISLLGEQGGEDGKALLAQILKREKEVEVIKGTRLPGVMSPLDIFKAAAMDALAKLAAYEYVDLIKQVYRTADNRTLRRIAKKDIEVLGSSVDE